VRKRHRSQRGDRGARAGDQNFYFVAHFIFYDFYRRPLLLDNTIPMAHKCQNELCTEYRRHNSHKEIVRNHLKIARENEVEGVHFIFA
jgi:hypothetical protein